MHLKPAEFSFPGKPSPRLGPPPQDKFPHASFPPDLEHRVEALLRQRISQLKMPPDIQPIFMARMSNNIRKTTFAWCVSISLINAGDAIFDIFLVHKQLLHLYFPLRALLSLVALASGLLIRTGRFPKLTSPLVGLPCVLFPLLAGIAGLRNGDPFVLTHTLDDAVLPVATAMVFTVMTIPFSFALSATCIALTTLFTYLSPERSPALVLQVAFFESVALGAIIVARHVQNLILAHLFLLNLRDDFRKFHDRERQAQLSSIAYTDPLTELPNRRYFDEICAAVAASATGVLPVSICMVDIDYFKKLNDSLGHPQGDRCLKLVAATLRNNLRSPADIVARFGGEEFVLLLQNTDLNAAYEVAERMRGAIMDLQHPNPGAPSGIVTASIGVADLHTPPIAIPTLLSQADQALYRAKLTGRNRVST